MSIQSISSVSSATSIASTLAASNQPVSSQKAQGNAPAGKPGGGGPPKAKPASSSISTSSSSSDTKIYDKMDTNKDGSVSVQEKAAYLVIHPEEATQDSDSINYNGQGNQTGINGDFASIINLSA